MLACRSVARRWHMPCPILILAWITVLREKKRGRSRDRSDCLPITSPVLFPYTILLSWEKGRFHNSYTVFLVMPVFKWYIETAKNGTNRFWHGYDFYRCCFSYRLDVPVLLSGRVPGVPQTEVEEDELGLDLGRPEHVRHTHARGLACSKKIEAK